VSFSSFAEGVCCADTKRVGATPAQHASPDQQLSPRSHCTLLCKQLSAAHNKYLPPFPNNTIHTQLHQRRRVSWAGAVLCVCRGARGRAHTGAPPAVAQRVRVRAAAAAAVRRGVFRNAIAHSWTAKPHVCMRHCHLCRTSMHYTMMHSKYALHKPARLPACLPARFPLCRPLALFSVALAVPA
jgi:hypothetical protein